LIAFKYKKSICPKNIGLSYSLVPIKQEIPEELDAEQLRKNHK